MTDRDRALDELSAHQFGAFARRQAAAIGLDKFALRRREKAGQIDAATDQVFAFRNAPNSFERRASIGLLHAGDTSALSVDTGAAIYDVAGFELEPVHIVRAHTGRRNAIDGVKWHFTRFLPSHHMGALPSGLRVAVPARVFADLVSFGDYHPKRIERAIDSGMAARLLNRSLLSSMADEWCKRGREGSAFLHAYLESRPVDWVPPASNVQRRFVELVKAAGCPEPRAEVNVGNAHRWLGRVDCLDPELPLIAEIDSDRFHLAPLDATADETRDGDMNDAGFVVVRFTEHQVWYERDFVVEKWRRERDKVRRMTRLHGSGA